MKNYIYLGLIIIFSFMVIYYVYLWHKSYRESLMMQDILSDYLDVIKFNEIDDYIIENKDAVIYVSVLGNEKINNFELKFKNTIRDNELRDVILYMNVSEDDLESVKSKFDIDGNFPYLVVYTNGDITDVYEIADNGYKTNKIIKYLNRIGVTYND